MNISKPYWGNVLAVIVLAVFICFGLFKRCNRTSRAEYTKGVIIGKHKASKGSNYLDYFFFANSEKFTGSEPLSFCRDCKTGDTVIVRFERGNPKNCELVRSFPVER